MKCFSTFHKTRNSLYGNWNIILSMMLKINMWQNSPFVLVAFVEGFSVYFSYNLNKTWDPVYLDILSVEFIETKNFFEQQVQVCQSIKKMLCPAALSDLRCVFTIHSVYLIKKLFRCVYPGLAVHVYLLDAKLYISFPVRKCHRECWRFWSSLSGGVQILVS